MRVLLSRALLVCAVLALGGALFVTAMVQSSRPTVVATFSVIADVVRNVGGDKIEVITIVGPDGDSEGYEPTPGDVVAIGNARLIFENGLGSEPWLDRIYASSRSRAERVRTSAGIELLVAEEAPGEFDPHVWHDVANVVRMADNVRDALARHDPANAATYGAQAERYRLALRELDSWVVARVGTLPPERRKLVTSHETFGYFARRYGFEIVGVGLRSFFTDAQPAASDVARLVRDIRTAGVPVVFLENVSDPRLMERIAADAAVRVGPPLYTDALGPPGSPGDTYIRMMTHNVTAITSMLAP